MESLSSFSHKLKHNLQATSVDHQQVFSFFEPLALLHCVSLLASCHIEERGVAKAPNFTLMERHYNASPGGPGIEEQRIAIR